MTEAEAFAARIQGLSNDALVRANLVAGGKVFWRTGTLKCHPAEAEIHFPDGSCFDCAFWYHRSGGDYFLAGMRDTDGRNFRLI